MIVIGLGNPGDRYSLNRHNVGFWLVDYLSNQYKITLKKNLIHRYFIGSEIVNGEKLFLVKPVTFMNKSGDVLQHVFRYTNLSLEDSIVVTDQMDLPVGATRLKKKGSHGGHNGLRSIVDRVGSSEFKRLYIGVGRPEYQTVVDYVLANPPIVEKPLYEKAITRAGECVVRLLKEEPEAVMNYCNQRSHVDD